MIWPSQIAPINAAMGEFNMRTLVAGGTQVGEQV
jgi:hypothetical protein